MLKNKYTGLWPAAEPMVKVDGVWRKASAAYIKVNGVFKKFYSETVGLESLVRWWDFNANLADYVNNALATLNDGAALGSASGKNAVRVFGGRYVRVPGLSFSGDWTVSLWYYPLDFTSYAHLLTNETSQSNFALKLMASTGVPYLHTAGSGSVMAATGLTLNKWSMVTFTYTNGTLRIYINGVLSVTQAATITGPAGAYLIGKGHLTEYSNGYERDVMRWNRALTPTEVAELYNIQK